MGKTVKSYPIRFDTDVNYIEINAYLGAARANSRLLRSTITGLFGLSVDAEIVIYAEEPGSVWHWIGVAIVGAGATWDFLESDIGKAAIDGYFGDEPAAYSRSLARRLPGAEAADSDSNLAEDDLQSVMESYSIKLAQEILRADPNIIRKGARDRVLPAEIILEYSSFFESCLLDEQIASIGFPAISEDVVPRSQLVDRASTKTAVDLIDQAESRIVDISVLVISGPVTDQRTQAKRGWSGRVAGGGPCTFLIEDKEFWGRIESREVSFSRGTTLRVQWSYELGPRGGKNYRVHRVLELDGKYLAQPLDDPALKSILGEYVEAGEASRIKSHPDDQGELFER